MNLRQAFAALLLLPLLLAACRGSTAVATPSPAPTAVPGPALLFFYTDG